MCVYWLTHPCRHKNQYIFFSVDVYTSIPRYIHVDKISCVYLYLDIYVCTCIGLYVHEDIDKSIYIYSVDMYTIYIYPDIYT